MNRLLLALALIGLAGTASAQTKPPPPSGATGSAGVKTQLQALHYKNVHDLRRGPDGQWTARATQGGVPKQVTITPKGTVTAR